MATEEAEEFGPLDAPGSVVSPAVGRMLGEDAEWEQEFFDSLKLDGFPEHEQRRRVEWLQLSASSGHPSGVFTP